MSNQRLLDVIFIKSCPLLEASEYAVCCWMSNQKLLEAGLLHHVLSDVSQIIGCLLLEASEYAVCCWMSNQKLLEAGLLHHVLSDVSQIIGCRMLDQLLFADWRLHHIGCLLLMPDHRLPEASSQAFVFIIGSVGCPIKNCSLPESLSQVAVFFVGHR